jgi:hypothetical protein
VNALALIAASLLSVHLTGPRHAVLVPRDAPRVVVIIDYRGPGYAQNLAVTVTATGGRIAPQRGTTDCRPADHAGLTCPLNPLRHGTSVWLSFLVTGLRAGTPLRVDAEVRSSNAGRANGMLIRPVARARPRRPT